MAGWDWIKNLLSLVPTADSKIVRLDLLGVAVVFFFFISYMYLQICFFFYIFIHVYQLASMLISRLFNLAWAFCSSLVPSGPKCVSAWSHRLNKQTTSTLLKLQILHNFFFFFTSYSMLPDSKNLFHASELPIVSLKCHQKNITHHTMTKF